MGDPKLAPRAAIAGLKYGLVFLPLLFLLGCLLDVASRTINRGNISIAYSPSPHTRKFQDLHLEKTSSIVALKIGGGDIRANMANVSHALIERGFAVRDYSLTLRALGRENLLSRKSLDPELLQRAAERFPESAAIAGSVEVVQKEPLRLFLVLNWIDMKTRKVIWSAKATYEGRRLAAGEETVADAARRLVDGVLYVVPRAEP